MMATVARTMVQPAQAVGNTCTHVTRNIMQQVHELFLCDGKGN